MQPQRQMPPSNMSGNTLRDMHISASGSYSTMQNSQKIYQGMPIQNMKQGIPITQIQQGNRHTIEGQGKMGICKPTKTTDINRVINLSSLTLSDIEISLMKKGLFLHLHLSLAVSCGRKMSICLRES